MTSESLDDETPAAHHTSPGRPSVLRVAMRSKRFMEGERIGPYRIVRLLGAGGMGEVLLARDESLDRDVAIKVVRTEGTPSLDAVERFRSEARTMARVEHPHVVRIHALDEIDGLPYIVMEHVPGLDLGKLLAKREAPFRVAQALAILDQICRGATAMHAAGIVHGDLKPSNVLFGPAFRVVISDFGLSRRVGASTSGWSTPTYGAPELSAADGVRPELEHRIDVYSIGVMAYEFLTGRLPFDSEMDRLDALASGRSPVRPSVRRPELDTLFDAPLLAALEADPEARTPSVDAFRRALAERGAIRTRASRHLRILVAVDDADDCDMIRRTLAREFRGSTFETAGDHATALGAAFLRRPDLLVMDLDTPSSPASALVGRVRALPLLARVPVIVLSAVGRPADWGSLDRLGANAFLGKPFDAHQLTSLAHALVS